MYQNNFRQLSKRPTNPSTKRATKKRPANQLSKQLVNQSNYISNNKLKDFHLPDEVLPLKVVTSCCMGKICNKGWKIKKCIVTTCDQNGVVDGQINSVLLGKIDTKFIKSDNPTYFCGKDIELCIFDGDNVNVDYVIEVCRRGKLKVCYLSNICLDAYDYDLPNIFEGKPVITVNVENCSTGAIHPTPLGVIDDLPKHTDDIIERLLSGCIEVNAGGFWECGTQYKIVLSAQLSVVIPGSTEPTEPTLVSHTIVDKCPCTFILSEDCPDCVDEKVIVKDTGFPDNLAGVFVWKINDDDTVTDHAGAKLDILRR